MYKRILIATDGSELSAKGRGHLDHAQGTADAVFLDGVAVVHRLAGDIRAFDIYRWRATAEGGAAGQGQQGDQQQGFHGGASFGGNGPIMPVHVQQRPAA